LVAGGGPWVDLLRGGADRFGLDDQAAHWISIRAMSVTARLLHALVPESVFTDDLPALRQRRADKQPSILVFDAERFLREEPAWGGQPLPENWDVTSDSIAARLAAIVEASELAMLKSTVPEGRTGTYAIQSAVEQGYLDAYFAHAAQHLPCIRCINLRCATWQEIRLTRSSTA
jgi:aspartokinase-like uncharacterized kinase